MSQIRRCDSCGAESAPLGWIVLENRPPLPRRDFCHGRCLRDWAICQWPLPLPPVTVEDRMPKAVSVGVGIVRGLTDRLSNLDAFIEEHGIVAVQKYVASCGDVAS